MYRWLLLLALMGLAACVPSTNPDDVAELDGTGLIFATTFGDEDGNRYVKGRGSIEPDGYVDLVVDGSALWIVGIVDGDGVAVVVADTDGNLSGFDIGTDEIETRPFNLASAAPGTPPGLVSGQGVLVLLPPASSGSADTNAIALASGGIAFVGTDGSVVISDGGGNRRLEVDALLDGRLTVSSDGRLAVLGDPTNRYDHGVVGDEFEASAVTLVSLATQEIVGKASFDVDVIEGMVPMFADFDGDGVDELVVTLSNADTGARLAVLDAAGDVIAESDPIGQGGRWRHQLAVAPFGPNGEIELVDIRTPHIGGTVEYFALVDGKLELAASQRGVTSHSIRSRNLDMAVAFDVDGDGQVELVVPTDSRDELAVLRRVGDTVEVIMTLPLGSALTTNLTAVESANGDVVLLAGLADGTVRVWR